MADDYHPRGSVWAFDFVVGEAPKPCIIVSNDERNESSFPFVHVVRVTTEPKARLRSIVELSPSDPVQGRAMCDEVEPISRDELIDAEWSGFLVTASTMRQIDDALRHVLGL